MTRLAIAINLDRCTGCNTCAMACKMQNNVPMGMAWNRVLNEECEFEVGVQGTYPHVSRAHLPVACQHCENPACLRVCPTGATYKDDKGRVEIDYDKCIGCRMCMGACPYSARTFNWEEPAYAVDFPLGDFDAPKHVAGAVEKCTFCANRLARGEEPACMEHCPGRARYWGDLDDPGSDVSRAIAGRPTVRLLEDKGTEPSVYYLA